MGNVIRSPLSGVGCSHPPAFGHLSGPRPPSVGGARRPLRQLLAARHAHPTSAARLDSAVAKRAAIPPADPRPRRHRCCHASVPAAGYVQPGRWVQYGRVVDSDVSGGRGQREPVVRSCTPSPPPAGSADGRYTRPYRLLRRVAVGVAANWVRGAASSRVHCRWRPRPRPIPDVAPSADRHCMHE